MKVIKRIGHELVLLFGAILFGGFFGYLGLGVILIVASMFTGQPTQQPSNGGFWVAVGIGGLVTWCLEHPDVVQFRRSKEPDWINDHL